MVPIRVFPFVWSKTGETRHLATFQPGRKDRTSGARPAHVLVAEDLSSARHYSRSRPKELILEARIRDRKAKRNRAHNLKGLELTTLGGHRRSKQGASNQVTCNVRQTTTTA